MQHSGVTEDDFREWLTEWKDQRSIEILNLQPGQRARKGAGQEVKWVGK
jgi:hypothetical protein